jgi:hypothetical protein
MISIFPLWTFHSYIATTSSGISYHLRYIYSICRCCWNVAIYEWKVHNGKIEIISFVVLKSWREQATFQWNYDKCVGGAMVNALDSSAVDREFEPPRLGQTKDFNIVICCFPANRAALRRNNKDLPLWYLQTLLPSSNPLSRKSW